MTVGRNEPCPCGSGKKFKSCCIDRSSRGVSRGLMALIAVIAAIAAVGIIPSLRGEKPVATQAAAPAPASNRAAAPAGKVWSAEHGHWHDANPAAATRSTPVPPQVEVVQKKGGSTPQPAGTPPPGKVWSAQHGHWHDAQR
jgi:hypothetical protein